jgi:putative hydrolase of the HAD superfamily
VTDARLSGVTAVTFDFGNTLVPVGRAALAAVVRVTAEQTVRRAGLRDQAAFLAAWGEERDRQFRDEIPLGREPHLGQRVVRVIARLRGMSAPGPADPWDDAAAAALVTRDEVDFAIEAYVRAFVDGMPPRAEAGATLERLAGRGYRLGILSNWPLAAAIERFVEELGWQRWLDAVCVSERIGVIKPHPAIFEAARVALGSPEPSRTLHVGDDWAADVVGARNAGWLAAHVVNRPDDSPLPGSERPPGASADVEVVRLDELLSFLPGPGSLAAPGDIHTGHGPDHVPGTP